MESRGSLGILLTVVVLLLIGAAAIGIIPILWLHPDNTTSLTVQLDAPLRARYGETIEIKSTVRNTGRNPAINARIKTVFTLGTDTIFSETRSVELIARPIETFTIPLMQEGLLQNYANKGTAEATVWADNAQSSTGKHTIDVWKPTATISVQFPEIIIITFPGIKVKAGTQPFKEMSAELTGSERGPFAVAAAVIIDAQYKDFFTMNRVIQRYQFQDKIIWVIGKSEIDPVHPKYRLFEATEFTASTRGADRVDVKIKVALLLILGPDRFLPIAENEYSFAIMR